MDIKQIFGKHHRRIATENIWKSVLAGVTVCFGVNTVFLALYWFFAFGKVWLGTVIGIPFGALCGALLYLFKYRVNDKVIARRIDSHGLEERMITMVELSEDDSYIAEIQRNDAIEKLSEFSQKNIKFNISTLFAVLATAFLTLSISFAALGMLAKAGKIPYGKELFGDSIVGGFEVVYTAEQGGYILGNQKQNVKTGESTSAVRAVAEDGWVFVSWNDGMAYPERSENDVRCNMTLKALFKRIDDLETDDDDSDSADDLPYGEVMQESGGGDSDDPNGETPKDEGEGNGGGKWQDKNQFIDGATYYRDYLEFYYQYAMGIFDSSNEIPKEIIEFFEMYFSGI